MSARFCWAGLLAVLVAPALADDAQLDDPLLAAAFAESRAACAAQGGVLDLSAVPITRVDLTGNGEADRIVSEEGAFCGPDLGFLGGSGGPRLHAIIGEHVQTLGNGLWLVQEARFVSEGEELDALPYLLVLLHGSACDSFGAAPCLIAYAWDGERLISASDFQP